MPFSFSSALSKHGGALFALGLIILGSFTLSDVMRESDQASLLFGALDLSWGKDILGHKIYRYDKFFCSYWILALWYKLYGVDPGEAPDNIVYLGNLLTFFIFSCALITYTWKLKLPCFSLAILASCLFSPVILLSMTFASPNLFSISALLILIRLWSKSSRWWQLIGIAVCTFLAVGFRQDAVFVLPIISLLGTRRQWYQLWSDRRVGAAFIGCILALITSRIVGYNHSLLVGEDFFFDPKISSGYLVFGLSAALFSYLLFAVSHLIWGKITRIPALLFFLVPLCFYLGLLYTPRHLLLIPVCVIASLSLPGGKTIWRKLAKRKLAKPLGYLVLLITFLPIVLGLHLIKLKSPELTIKQPTLYPTADGYWPMGALGSFLLSIPDATTIPIDHNQEVWNAWKNHTFSSNDLAYRDALYHYAKLAAKIQGHHLTFAESLGPDMLTTERIIRRRDGISLTQGKLPEDFDFYFVGSEAIKIIEVEPKGSLRKGSVSNQNIRILAANKTLGNDFILIKKTDPLYRKKIKYLEGHYSTSIRGVNNEEWIAIKRLPEYMSTQSYGENK